MAALIGGSGGGCFLGHTPVRVPGGERRIDELQAGDTVLSFDDRGQVHEARVLKLHVHEGEQVVRYRLWGGGTLDATPNHWVLNQFNAFVAIGTLGSDDCLVDENSHLRPIVAREPLGEGTVYNLTVEGYHTFIAGKIRVHNAGLGAGLIAGAGGGGGGKGGGGGSNNPKEVPDNLNSTQYATLIDLISEGEIEGLKNGHKSIYVNNTQLQNNSGTYNFKGVTVETRNGTQNQSAIAIASDIRNEIPVGILVEKDNPITRSITEPTVNAVQVTISVPALQVFQNDGDVVGSTFGLSIQVQYNGGGFNAAVTDTITGRSGDQFERSYLVKLTGAFPVDVRVVRTTDDSTSIKTINAFSWSSYGEITYSKLRYPNSALVAMRVNAEQFNAIPSRSYLVRGIKVSIPNNATVDSTTGRLIYSGIWSGTFGAAQWTTDPAWILWDLLTSTRYGFGDHIQAAQLDKWAFYAASQYASALVPDGFGGQEPRFSANVNIQTQEDAYKLVNDMASIFRAMPFWGAGTCTLGQDRPADTSYLFTYANVTEDGFSYQGGSLKNRPTVAVVSYLSLKKRDIDYEVVEDQAAIKKYGVVTREVSAFACTSRGQAHRLGEWLLYSEWNESEIVSFTASIDAGVVVRPGQIIEISDPVRAGSRRGGRILASTTTTVTVDDTTGLTYVVGSTLSVVMSDGTVQSRAVLSITGAVITVSVAFASAPNVNSVWVYQSAGLVTSTWRVLTVQEQDGARYAITALAHNASKYDYIERGVTLEPRDVTNLNEIPAAPTDMQIDELLYEYQDQVRAKVLVSWKPVLGVNQYQVQWRKELGNWTVETVDGPDFQVLNITPGLFEFEVYSLNATQKPSITALTGSISALGKTAPPADVSNLNYTISAELGVLLTWDMVPDIDLDLYEIRRGASWGAATVVTQVKANTYKIGSLDAGSYTYLVKAIDSSGVYSTNAATITVTLARPNATTVSSSVQNTDVVLTWAAPAVTTYQIAYYRVTYGNTYATSVEITQTRSLNVTVAVTWFGSRTFYVVPVDLVGNTATTQGSTTVTISGAAAPTISAAVGGSMATLTWNAVAGTLPTASYEIRRGATFATAAVLANITGTSYTLKADWSGNQTFWVVARDVNWNYGTEGSVVATVNAAGATSVTASFSGQNAIFSWAPVKGTLDTSGYLLKRGSTWAGGTAVATISSTAYTLKADWGGTARFWVAALDVNGTEGTPASADVVVTVPIAPTVTQQVIDNNVLLRWNDCTQTLPILNYEVRRGSTWAGATVIGTKQGGFTTVFETASGTYTYWIAGIDSAGNYGTPGSVNAVLNQPPDYVLQLDQNSTFSGTKVNIITDAVLGQVVGIDSTETWQSHFTSRSWSTPQDQINAGFAYYAMPTTTSASYEEEFDYGTILAGTKVSATLTRTLIAGAVTVTPTLRVRGTTSTAATYSQAGTTTITVTSTAHGLTVGDYVFLDFTTGTATDGTYVVATAASNTFTVTAAASATTSGNVSWVKWTSYANASEVFASSFRYFRIRYDFAAAGGDDLLLLTALNVRLDSKLRNDAGSGTANSADSGGTTVPFNATFVDVQSITVTPLATTGVIAVYDFVDVPNPTSFKVLLFNTSGTRVSGGFSWSARGV
jgi:hypothetical protein